MSSGAMMQIAAIGKQDVDTVLNAQLTFFKGVTRRHTPFAMEPKTVEFTCPVTWGRRGYAQLERIGDLCCRVWLYVELGNLDHGNGGAYYTNDVGRAMIDEITLEMGNVQYEKIQPEIMHAWEELTTDSERQLGKLTGKATSTAQLVEWAKKTQLLFVPIDFFFCSYEDALPLVAMHLTDIKIYIKLKQKSDVICPVGDSYTVTAEDAIINDCSLTVETIVLDDTEREWFVSTPLKYVFQQWQVLTNTIRRDVTSHNHEIIFNHPVKEFIVLMRKESNGPNGAKNYFNFSGQETGVLEGEAFKTMSLTFNSNTRVQPMGPFYYRIIQTRCHHTRIPTKHIYVYSFSLYPEDKNPTGTVNLSRVDNTRLLFTFGAPLPESMDVMIYARNFNSCTLQKGVLLLTFAS
jgi:hypothetical protein